MELLVERIVDDARRHGRMFARPVAMIDGETVGLAALDQRCRNGRRADQILTERREVVAVRIGRGDHAGQMKSEEHTSELQSLMRISYAVFCLKKKNTTTNGK